jgi:hypothetical protein
MQKFFLKIIKAFNLDSRISKSESLLYYLEILMIVLIIGILFLLLFLL